MDTSVKNVLNHAFPAVAVVVVVVVVVVSALIFFVVMKGTVPDDIPDPVSEEEQISVIFDVDLSGNMLDNWPDQRDGESESETESERRRENETKT